MTLEAYVAGHYGRRGGEFRLGIDVPPGLLASAPAGIHLPPAILDLGIALRVNL